jgi:hypothetical protein
VASVVYRIGTNVEYGPYVELGTSRMAARPHLRPGFDAQRAAAVKEAGRVFALAVTAAAR